MNRAARMMSEDELMELIRSMCRHYGLYAFHDTDARRSWGPGFPDLVVVGRGGCIFRECKSTTGSLSAEQRAWGAILQAAGMRWSTWRPADWISGRIQTELSELAAVQAELFEETALWHSTMRYPRSSTSPARGNSPSTPPSSTASSTRSGSSTTAA